MCGFSHGGGAVTSPSRVWHDCLCSRSYTVQLRLCCCVGFCMNPGGKQRLPFDREEKNSQLLSNGDSQQGISQPGPLPHDVLSPTAHQHHHSAPLCGGTLQQINISQTCLVRVLINFCLERLCHSSLCSCRDSFLRLS